MRLKAPHIAMTAIAAAVCASPACYPHFGSSQAKQMDGLLARVAQLEESRVWVGFNSKGVTLTRKNTQETARVLVHCGQITGFLDKNLEDSFEPGDLPKKQGVVCLEQREASGADKGDDWTLWLLRKTDRDLSSIPVARFSISKIDLPCSLTFIDEIDQGVVKATYTVSLDGATLGQHALSAQVLPNSPE